MTNRSQPSALMDLKPYPLDRYEGIDLNRLTTFTIYLLNQFDIPTTFENIGVANFRMFPRRFALVGFPEYPDVTRVNRALLQLRPKYRNWATGNAKIGWQLTVAGQEEARALHAKLGDNPSVGLNTRPGEISAEPGGKSKRTVHAEDTLGRIKNAPLFRKYREGWANVDPLEVYDVLEAYTHTPPDALRHRLRRLKSVAVSARDEDALAFLEELGQRFAHMFDKR